MGNFYKIILSFAIGILLPLEFLGQTDQNNVTGNVECCRYYIFNLF